MARRWKRRTIRAVWTLLRDPVRRHRWARRIRGGCRIALLLPLLLGCLGCALLGALARRAAAAEAGDGLDVMLVVDNSNSMFDKGGVGSDPDLHRIEAAQLFVGYLGVDGGAISHRLGVIFFGGRPRLVVPLTPLADRARRDEMAALIAAPQRMDWTDPAAALALARETLLAEREDGRQPVVVLLTDGKPEWSSDPTEAERRAAVESLRRAGEELAGDGARLFIVLLANQATDADPEIRATYVPLWQEMAEAAQGGFYAVRQAGDLIAVYHDVLVLLSGAGTDGPVVEARIDGETRVEAVSVEPDLARVTFVVRASRPDVAVTIRRPDGRELAPGDAGVRHAAQGTTAIWAVARPQPGEWTVVMEGRGSVTVWKDYMPAAVPPTPTPSPSPPPTAAPPAPSPSLQLVAPSPGDTWQVGGVGTLHARWVTGEKPLAAGGRLTVTLAFPGGAPQEAATGTVGEPLTLDVPRETGICTVTVTAMGFSPTGHSLRGEAAAAVAVRRAGAGWAWVAAVGLPVLALGGWRLHAGLNRLPCVAGRLRVLEAPPGYAGPALVDLSLLNRRLARLGGARSALPLPAEGGPWATVRALPDGSGIELAPGAGQIVLVDGRPLAGPHLLADGDHVDHGGIRLRYECLHCGL